MLRLPVAALAAALLASPPAWGKNLVGTAGSDRIVGTSHADVIVPRESADAVEARGGDDRIAAPWDGSVDAIACGAGRDLALADLADSVASDCELVARQLSRDETAPAGAQHETEVEPDSFAWGKTVVVAFQVGRYSGGGAAALGWATSKDAGRTWRAGALDFGMRALSDPVVAYDAVHATWLISFLGFAGAGVDVFVTRSRDGVSWGTPVAVAVAPSAADDYDKEWIVCDNGGASPFRGRCYVSYLELASGTIVTRASRDGGLTWGAPVGGREGIGGGVLVNGAAPVVRPNGDLVVLFTVFGAFADATGDWIAAVRSVDGGATFAPVTRVASLEFQDVFGLRAPPLVSADVDATGTIRAVWSDCRFDEECNAAGIVLVSSPNGTSWTPPVPVPGSTPRVDAVVPALAASGTKLAVAYYTLPQPDGCAIETCRGLDAWLLEQADGRWGAPQRLSPQAMPLRWLADGGLGQMVGDYISVSWTGGRPVAAVALATAPSAGAFREAIFAAARP